MPDNFYLVTHLTVTSLVNGIHSVNLLSGNLQLAQCYTEGEYDRSG